MSLFLVNAFNPGNYNHIIRTALATDFPVFEPRCKLSPITLCEHPHQPCRKSQLSLVGYAVYNKHTGRHDFKPLLSDLSPIFDLTCSGCAALRGKCKEGCSTYAEELVGYKVCYWSGYTEGFREKVIDKDSLNPLFHGYFSYRLWREELAEIQKKRTESKRKREQTHELPSQQPTPKKKRTESPSCSPSPPLYSPSSPEGTY